MSDELSVCVVVPVFNEASILEHFYSKIRKATAQLPYNFEIIFVNDGSSDKSPVILRALAQNDPKVKVVNLSRNFGQQNAVTAGIDFANADAVIMMDCDLEDDPQDIPIFIDYWKKGYEVVYARRCKRNAPLLKKVFFSLFHRLNYAISEIKIDSAGIFCLMDRKIVKLLRNNREKNKYLPGLRQWFGFNQIGVEIARGSRYDGNPRVKTWQLTKLALDSFVSFSSVPLKVSMFLGIVFSILSFVSILVVIYIKLFTGLAILGWASTISIILLIGGTQLICIGLQGEYIARIFDEVKDRPNYIVRDTCGFHEHTRGGKDQKF